MKLKLYISFLLGLWAFLGIQAQMSDRILFQKFGEHFSLLDSLIFSVGNVTGVKEKSINLKNSLNSVDASVDSLLYAKVEKQMEAMKAETGLLISGQTYYRLDEGFGIDDEDALSRYTAKVQVELRWNFLSSSLINRRSRLNELEIKGELERVGLERERIGKLIETQKEYFQEEYDSLLAGVLKLRIANLQLLSDAQQYLVSDRSISTDELLKIMDEQAIAERLLVTIPKDYPLAFQLVSPHGAEIRVDTARFMKYICDNDLSLYEADLQIKLLNEKEKSTNYWRTLNLSPFFRYSFYVRPEARNTANVDAGLAFQIPLSGEQPRKRKALRAERFQKTMEKESQVNLVTEKVHFLFDEIERANRGLAGELKRIEKMRDYMQLRKKNYHGHIGEYNFMSRIKEYNHYLTCWENFYTYQFKRDCCIAELQAFLSGQSVLDFCTIVGKE
ncbi:MAG: hypothetical protein IJB61_11960 [Bacteroides sp]|nr:hypothetical protein [Bacteroides sp.]